MILGSMKQVQLIEFLKETGVFRRAFEWIRALPPEPKEGITELEGHSLYVNVHGYATRARENCVWESHRHTADLQLCLSGGELIDWTPIRFEGESTRYDDAKDFEAWPEGIVPATTLRLEGGMFAIFLPGELHRPVIADGKNVSIRKLVVKIDARFLPYELASRT